MVVENFYLKLSKFFGNTFSRLVVCDYCSAVYEVFVFDITNHDIYVYVALNSILDQSHLQKSIVT